jgi:hypothetical protein
MGTYRSERRRPAKRSPRNWSKILLRPLKKAGWMKNLPRSAVQDRWRLVELIFSDGERSALKISSTARHNLAHPRQMVIYVAARSHRHPPHQTSMPLLLSNDTSKAQPTPYSDTFTWNRQNPHHVCRSMRKSSNPKANDGTETSQSSISFVQSRRVGEETWFKTTIQLIYNRICLRIH